MEYCNGGNLGDYIKKNGGILTQAETIFIFSELKDAFLTMYANKIIHRDIKP